MRFKHGILCALAALAVVTGCSKKVGEGGSITLQNQTDSVSYAIGADIARGMKQQKVEINPDVLAQALKDYGTENVLLNEQQCQQVIMSWQMGMQAKMQEEMMKAAGENLTKGQSFLAENKGKPGVQSLPSGVQYKEITPGTGKSPKLTDQVTCHYKGTLIDGKTFDSSYDRGEPATFPLMNVIKGWQETLPLMKEGAKWQIWVPADAGYGEQAPPDIGPNQVLIFEVELLKVLDAGAAPAMQGTPR